MAAAGSWPSIAAHGLRSTSALLDLFEITGGAREAIESQHRPDYISINHPAYGQARIRDQKPMDDSGLRRALTGTDLTPSDWYRTLNRKVFFWLTEERLSRMLGAGAYRKSQHTVITLETSALVEAHIDDITLSAINSGATKPMPKARGPNTFRRLGEFPYDELRSRRRRLDVVVELAVEYAVPQIDKFVVDVRDLSASDLPSRRQVLRASP